MRTLISTGFIFPMSFLLSGWVAWSQDVVTPSPDAAIDKATDDKANEKVTVLASGRKVSPAGEQVVPADLTLNILASPDSQYAFVTTNGYNSHDFTVVE